MATWIKIKTTSGQYQLINLDQVSRIVVEDSFIRLTSGGMDYRTFYTQQKLENIKQLFITHNVEE